MNNLPRNWMELGEGPKKASRDEIYASINHRGHILINRRAFEEMSYPEAVVFLFDPDRDTIGLRPASLATLNAFRLQPKGGCGHRVVCARPLTLKHDLRIDGTVRFRTAAVENGILVLDLRNMVNVNGTPRKGKRKR